MNCPECQSPFSPFVEQTAASLPYSGAACVNCGEVSISEFGQLRKMTPGEAADPCWVKLVAVARVAIRQQRVMRMAARN